MCAHCRFLAPALTELHCHGLGRRFSHVFQKALCSNRGGHPHPNSWLTQSSRGFWSAFSILREIFLINKIVLSHSPRPNKKYIYTIGCRFWTVYWVPRLALREVSCPRGRAQRIPKLVLPGGAQLHFGIELLCSIVFLGLDGLPSAFRLYVGVSFQRPGRGAWRAVEMRPATAHLLT